MKLTTEQLQQIIQEELEAVIDEKASKKSRKKKRKKVKKKAAKKDACYRKVKSRYKVWPSAYASGALVKCRKVGAKNWGNKSKKNESLNESEGEFKPHMMYDPKTNKKVKANKVEDHERLAKKGYTHVDPAALRKVLKDEGGASGMDPFVKAIGKGMEDEIKKTLDAMPDVGQHKDKDYILDDEKEIDVVKEQIMNEEELEEKKSKRCTKVTKKASSTRKTKKWMKCVKSDSGGYKRIHWGQKGVRVTGKSGNTKRKKSFKARHKCGSAKSNTPQGQACKDWAE